MAANIDRAPDLPALHGESWAALDGHGHVCLRGGVADMLLTLAQAREVADDLLAAADHAEEAGRADA